MFKRSLVVMFALALGTSAFAEHGFPGHDHGHGGPSGMQWPNRPNVIRAANTLADEIEHLHEALHDVNAPADLIGKIHHTQDTVLEFVQDIQNATYEVAIAEFNHIREDIGMIKMEFNKYPGLLQNQHVATEFYMMKNAYRYLDHQMFAHFHMAWSADAVADVERAFALTQKAH